MAKNATAQMFDNQHMTRLALPVLLIAVLNSCQDSVKTTAGQQPGRFQIVTTQTHTLKLDTISGQAWLLDQEAEWKLLHEAVSAASGAYNTYLVVAQKPNLSSFDVPKAQRPPLIDERIRSIPGVVSVDLLKPGDPLGIRDLIKPK